MLIHQKLYCVNWVMVTGEQRDFVRLGEKAAMPAADVAIANKYISV
ncbi:hypothetical protein H6G36_30315 [Anabaena minutissima FACHB-250]|nr:hypothetical protein [Anabaena minutissima FACHB-250]